MENTMKTTTRDEALASEVRAAMEADGLTMTKTAGLCGINKTRFSRWLSGNYEGDNSRVEEDVRRWLESRRAESEMQGMMPSAPEFVDTPSARSVTAAMSFAQMAGSIAVVYGGAGIGKTSAIRHYQDQAPNVWVVTATPVVARPGPLLQRVAQALGVRTSGALHLVEANIVDRIRDTRGLIVIDEAQHLSHAALDVIRSIHDSAGVGVVLAGNEIVYAQMTGGTRSVGFAQLFSRVAKRVRLTRPRDGDVAAILDAWGVADKETRKYALSIARRPGALRGLSQTLRLASMFGSGSINRELLRDAWTDLGGDV